MDDVATADLHNHDPSQHLAPPTDPELQSSVRPLNQPEQHDQDQSSAGVAIPAVEVEHDAEQLENGSRSQPMSLTPGSGNDGLGHEVEGVDLPLTDDGVLMNHHPHHHHQHHQHHHPHHEAGDPSTPSNPQMQPDLHHGYLVPGNKQMPISEYPLPQPLPQSFIPHFQSPPQPESSPVVNASQNDGYFKNMKLVTDPPDLDKWRERLFNVEDTIVLSEEEFQTYFPHVDNVYSHRSTQKYKRKPFISHYWDCRLKGRPPGTPKTHDPNKKKRKRTARERNLCDVKIKITEYFPGAIVSPPGAEPGFGHMSHSNHANSFLLAGSTGSLDGSQPFGVLTPSATLPPGHPGATGARYYTIQRVNGNGGNGRTDAVGGPHRHTLEESDRIKKNSVQRSLLKEEKEKKKSITVSQTEQKTYHKRASGYAFATVKKHVKESDLKLYGSCFCPFVQRVWIALEVKGVPYQYVEIDPYKKPQSLLEVNPRGLVPALRHGNWGCYESSVLMEYLEDLDVGNPLLPPGDPQLRAHCRLWADHINRNVIPCFYRLLQEQDIQKQLSITEELKEQISKLVNASHVHGPFFLGRSMSFVDIYFAPWILRLGRVLKPYRGWPDPERGSRWAAWVDAVEMNDHVMATTSADELYLDSYQRYAENRPNTSLLANAINNGHTLP